MNQNEVHVCPYCRGDLYLWQSYPVFIKEYCDYDCEPEQEEENIYKCSECGREVTDVE